MTPDDGRAAFLSGYGEMSQLHRHELPTMEGFVLFRQLRRARKNVPGRLQDTVLSAVLARRTSA